MFGGTSAGIACDPGGEDEFCSATWRWDGETWSVALDTSSSAPAPASRRRHAMAYDPLRQQVVLFGGQPATGQTCDTEADFCRDTWLWDGTGWTQGGQSAAAPQPSGRVEAAMAFSPAHGRVVLFGGDTGNGPCDDGSDRWCDAMWTWSGDAWGTTLPGSGRPSETSGSKWPYYGS